MASISNSVHLDCSWETSYSQPFVPTWSAMLHVPQGNAAGQCYHLFFSKTLVRHVCPSLMHRQRLSRLAPLAVFFQHATRFTKKSKSGLASHKRWKHREDEPRAAQLAPTSCEQNGEPSFAHDSNVGKTPASASNTPATDPLSSQHSVGDSADDWSPNNFCHSTTSETERDIKTLPRISLSLFFAVEWADKQNRPGQWPPSQILSILIVAGRPVIVSHSSLPGPQCYMCHRAMLRASVTIYFSLSLFLSLSLSLSLSLHSKTF